MQVIGPGSRLKILIKFRKLPGCQKFNCEFDFCLYYSISVLMLQSLAFFKENRKN
jgi:hypothetical protein